MDEPTNTKTVAATGRTRSSVLPPADPATDPVHAAPLADDLFSRWERTKPGRLLVLAVIILVGSVLVIDNLPGSELKRSLAPVVGPVEKNLGLKQNWALFAPNPPRKQSSIFVQLEFSDGSQGRWQPPAWNGLTGTYTGYRWRKWVETVLSARSSSRQAQSARTIGRLASRDGHTVTHVILWRIVRRVSDGTDRVISRTRLISVAMEDEK